jgi:hypothetical protein
LRDATQYSQRRNDVAHGVADYFVKPEEWGAAIISNTFALYPSQASFKERTLIGVPSYCMTSADLNYFFTQIYQLQKPAMDLAISLMKRKRRPSLQKWYAPALQSANPSADQNSPPKDELPQLR